MALQQLEKPDISKLASICRNLFIEYVTSDLVRPASRQIVERQLDRFFTLEPSLTVLIRSKTSLDCDEIRDLVMGQLSALRANLEFVTSRNRSDISSFPKEPQNHRLEGTTSEAIDAIEAIISRLKELREVIRQHPALNHEGESEDRTERGPEKSDLVSIKRVVKSNSPAASPSLQDHLATSILERHSSLRQLMKQRQQPTHIQQTTIRGVTSAPTESSGGPTESRSNRQESRDVRLDTPQPRSSLKSSSIASSPQSSTTTMVADGRVNYPKPPKAEHGKPAPQCPYCYKVLGSSDLSQPAWKRHVNEDLNPYICLFVDCNQRGTSFQNDEVWTSHMENNHGESWPCKLLNPCNERRATITQSSSSKPRTELACPLCDSWSLARGANLPDESWIESYKLGELAKHIRDHLLRLAFDSSDELRKSASQTSPTFSSESTVGEGHSLEQDELKVPEAIGMPEKHNPAVANEREGCYDMALEWNNNPLTLSSTRDLESCKSHQDTCAEAETVHEKTVQLRSRSSSSENPQSLSSIVKIAKELFEQRKYQESEKKYRNALELHANVSGASLPCIISIKGNLANALVRQGKHEEAVKVYQEILDVNTEALSEEHPHRLSCRSNLASILERKGEYAEAEVVYRDVWELQRRTLGDNHPDTLASYNKLANALTRLKRFDEAVVIYKEALETRRKVLGAEHSDTIITLGNLANLLRNQGQYKEAKDNYTEAMLLGMKVLEDDHPHLKWIMARVKEAQND